MRFVRRDPAERFVERCNIFLDNERGLAMTGGSDGLELVFSLK